MKRPAFQFYPADWRNDSALRMCSMAARGLWIDMIAIMHSADPYGHLIVAGKPVDTAALAKLVGEPVKEVKKWLQDLQSHDVFSITPEGIIYSRRMIRDEKERDGWRDRQSRHRNVTDSVTRDVTDMSRRSSSSPSSSTPSGSGESGSTGDRAPVDNSLKPDGEKVQVKTGEAIPGWWTTNWGIEAKGKELNFPPITGELHGAYKSRIFDEIKRREREGADVNTMAVIAASVESPA